MDILKVLDPTADYTTAHLQLLIGAWVLSGALERTGKISTATGHVDESDYDKASIYSLLYSMYRSMGNVADGNGGSYEFTFNTWGYDWPSAWGDAPTSPQDPQRFGRNAYSGLFHFDHVREYAANRDGHVHVVEMGCGTGAGAHHICRNVFPSCTYEAVDMQQAAIRTCERKFVPELGGRLVATCCDCTEVTIQDSTADLVAVCETHVTEVGGTVTEEDQKFFRQIRRILKPGGYLAWGNAIPHDTWQPCFDFLASIGIELVTVADVTRNAIVARDQDESRMNAYVDEVIKRFFAFRIPILGRKKQAEARIALKNFARHPGTNLYRTLATGEDTYKVALLQTRAA